MSRFQRRRVAGEENRATALELFYDLVFVFAITQVSHLLLGDLTREGAGRALLILLVVWWAWNYTTWVTNELDPDAVAVRVVIIGVMLGSLVMAVAIPRAFGEHGLLFAGAYVAIQIGRHLFLTFVAGRAGTIERERALHILIWFLFSAPLWLAGALAEGPPRTALWLVALAVDYAAPLVVYRLPGRRLRSDAWNVETSHFAERFQLFIIIALGESIVITGATTAELDLGPMRLLAFALAFLTTAALWWLYFTYVAQVGQHDLEAAPDRTTAARDGYTYLHVVIVAGIIVGAVGDELVIAHPTDVLPITELTVVIGGPVLYLLALLLFRLRLEGSVSRNRLAGIGACLGLAGLGTVLPALAVAALLVAILVLVIVTEHLEPNRQPSSEARAESERQTTPTAGPA